MRTWYVMNVTQEYLEKQTKIAEHQNILIMEETVLDLSIDIHNHQQGETFHSHTILTRVYIYRVYSNGHKFSYLFFFFSLIGCSQIFSSMESLSYLTEPNPTHFFLVNKDMISLTLSLSSFYLNYQYHKKKAVVIRFTSSPPNSYNNII